MIQRLFTYKLPYNGGLFNEKICESKYEEDIEHKKKTLKFRGFSGFGRALAFVPEARKIQTSVTLFWHAILARSTIRL